MPCAPVIDKLDGQADEDDSVPNVSPNSGGGVPASPGTGGEDEATNGPPKNSSSTFHLSATVIDDAQVMPPDAPEKPQHAFFRGKVDKDDLTSLTYRAAGDDPVTGLPERQGESSKPASGRSVRPGGNPATNNDPAAAGSIGGIDDLAPLGGDSDDVKSPPPSPDVGEGPFVPFFYKLPNEDDYLGDVSSGGSSIAREGTGGGDAGTNCQWYLLHQAILAARVLAVL